MTNTTEHREELGIEPGVFALPTPEHMDAGRPSSHIQGASKAVWDELDENAEPFPMIVWLRGDEPWFSQFDMDAESVMSALGIKRSRLTQISGKDLRVGRVRMDRYIRPVYRSLDVEQYLKWTRATASHQKSSDAIKIATDHLQQQAESIQSTLANITASFSESIKAEMSAFITETVSSGMTTLVNSFDTFTQNIDNTTSQVQQKTDLMSKAFDELTSSLHKTIKEYSCHQAAALETLTLQMHQLSEKTALMEERLQAWDNMLQSNLTAIAAEIADLKKSGRFSKALSRKPKQLKIATPTPSKPRLATRSAPARRKVRVR